MFADNDIIACGAIKAMKEFGIEKNPPETIRIEVNTKIIERKNVTKHE